MQRARLQVIGIGSPSGDDRVGWVVIEQLQRCADKHPHLRLLALDRPGTALIEELEQADTTWLVDALLDPEHIGLRRQPSLAELVTAAPQASSHGFGLAQTLQLAQSLGRLPDKLQIHTISIGQADPLNCTLSPEVAQSTAALSRWLQARIDTHLDPELSCTG